MCANVLVKIRNACEKKNDKDEPRLPLHRKRAFKCQRLTQMCSSLNLLICLQNCLNAIYHWKWHEIFSFSKCIKNFISSISSVFGANFWANCHANSLKTHYILMNTTKISCRYFAITVLLVLKFITHFDVVEFIAYTQKLHKQCILMQN